MKSFESLSTSTFFCNVGCFVFKIQLLQSRNKHIGSLIKNSHAKAFKNELLNEKIEQFQKLMRNLLQWKCLKARCALFVKWPSVRVNKLDGVCNLFFAAKKLQSMIRQF